MTFPVLTVTTGDSEKSRSFSASCLGMICCDVLLPAQGNKKRPVFAQFVASQEEMRPFLANVRLGRALETSSSYRRRGGDAYEFLKSAGHRVALQRFEEGVLATVWLPEPFALDPGMVDPHKIQFACLTPARAEVPGGTALLAPYLTTEDYRHKLDADDAETLVALAPYVTQMLDTRVHAPLLKDPLFSVALVAAMFREGMAVIPGYGYGLLHQGQNNRALNVEVPVVGYPLPVVLVSTTHEAFEALLAAEVANFLRGGTTPPSPAL